LIAQLRQKSAIIGDSISYLGQVVVLAVMIGYVPLTLAHVFVVMAGTSGLAALVQLSQQRLTFFPAPGIRDVVKDYWSIGSWSLANNVIWTMRVQLFPWALAMLHGPALAGLFQSALNVLNVANPVIIGLCNIIPQIAAKALAQGKETAWRAIRSYVLIGIPPMLLYYAAVFIIPAFILGVIYGPNWPHEELVTALRILAVAAIMNYAAEMICAYLHGVDEARLALVVNGIGTAAVVAFAFPLTMAFGLNGAAAAFAVAAAVRLTSSRVILSGFINNDRVHLA
jgi:O-antigen/teichoic acid export membrane protein